MVLRADGRISKKMIEKKGRSLLFAGKTMGYMLLIGIAIVMVIPFVWMISTSLKPPPDIMSYPPKFVPNPVVWVNYLKAWEAAPFAMYLLNSLTVALFAKKITKLHAGLLLTSYFVYIIYLYL